MAEEVLLLLGADLGDPKATFMRVEDLLAGRCGAILARSRDHWTEPWGFAGAHLFLNRALLIATELEPLALLQEVLAMERELGRERGSAEGYASRSIDIDLLLWKDRVVTLPALKVPHPRLHERAFALAPAADLVPHWRHPLSGNTVLRLLDQVL
ncbi:MAG: 2-amino-4-hydroxy-6-hydroxymethyldihydropteridine diphosphokinase [Flavobacteriales bacterium]|nr:2-amino-4-hydroxy-6-hydroxymethyldihydropteridine diphosphokinase [Flavobacteriales bacterium]MBP6698333.1 2-amino-4-hydroxy-6-hydroxymethyldihydropteridine diphosphokinase [Flavobacteriales bacterium]